MSVIIRDFESFLIKKGNIKSAYISYYIKWVSDCYRFLSESESKRLSSDQKKQFLSQMAKTHEDWQVKQADTALRLYDYFLSRYASETSRDSSSSAQNWKLIEEKLRDAGFFISQG